MDYFLGLIFKEWLLFGRTTLFGAIILLGGYFLGARKHLTNANVQCMKYVSYARGFVYNNITFLFTTISLFAGEYHFLWLVMWQPLDQWKVQKYTKHIIIGIIFHIDKSRLVFIDKRGLATPQTDYKRSINEQ